MASWYGPGFHGGSTANGERFNANEMTAAHRTLPIPSIVRVTHVGNGRTAVVRINDRGPFAHNRIIDLSKAAAARLGMLGEGVAKVKIEYLPQPSERYVALLHQGRNPSNIDVERDVLMGGESFAVASVDYQPTSDERTWLERINPISSARAEEPRIMTKAEVIPVETRTTQELPPLDEPPATLPKVQPAEPQPVVGTTNVTTRSPFDLLPQGQKLEDPKAPVAAPAVAQPELPVASAPTGHWAVQLGVYANEFNAANMKDRFADVGTVVVDKFITNGRTLHRVRVTSLPDEAAARKIRNRALSMGVPDAKIIKL